MSSKMQIRITDGTSFGTQYNSGMIYHPETNINQVDGLLDYYGKVKLELMNVAVLGGGGILSPIPSEDIPVDGNNIITAAQLFTQIIKKAVEMKLDATNRTYSAAHELLNKSLAGRYFQVQKAGGVTITTDILQNSASKEITAFTNFYGGSNFLYNYHFDFPIKDDEDTNLNLENGDFVVFNSITANITGLPTINIDNAAVEKKVYDQSEGALDTQLEYVSGGEFNIVEKQITFHNLHYADISTKTVKYLSVEVTIIGDSGFPSGGLALKIGSNNNIYYSTPGVEDIEIAGEPAWKVSHTFYDVEFTLTQAEWDAVYSMEGVTNNVYVNFGVINNTYPEASRDNRGVVKIATNTEIGNETPNLALDTPGFRHALSLWGFKVADIPLADETKKGLIQLANSSEIKLPAVSLSSSLTPSVLRTKEMIDYWASIPVFNTLEDANASGLASVPGKVVFIKT